GQGQGQGQPRPGRRRRRRGGNRPPTNMTPGPYANNAGQDGGVSMMRPPPSQGPRRPRRGRGGSRNGSGDRRNRGGLELLRDMQQIGAALDPTERLIME